MSPARRPATSAPRPSWQKTSAAKIHAEMREAARRRLRLRRLAEPGGGVDERPEGRRRDQEMQREALWRDLRALAQARSHHPPADERLERQQAGRDGHLPPERALELASPPEEQARQDERRADDARQQPMRPFPPENALEAVERHVRIEPGVLRDLFVAVELGLPFRRVQRRNNAGDRLPLGDGEAGFGEPRRAADQHHEKNQARDGDQPETDGAASIEAYGLGGGGRAVRYGHGRRRLEDG